MSGVTFQFKQKRKKTEKLKERNLKVDKLGEEEIKLHTKEWRIGRLRMQTDKQAERERERERERESLAFCALTAVSFLP